MSPLERLKGGLVVSCQPVDGGPMDDPNIISAMACAAVAGGAAGLRIEGLGNLRATRPLVNVPIIGIIKRDVAESPVRITVTTQDVTELIAAGADIIAYDATPRPRTEPRDTILKSILSGGALAMADCATSMDARAALEGGAAIIGTTLSGYTAETATTDTAPDLALIRNFRQLGGFVMAEGRINTPEFAAYAMQAGADAVTVGTALTRLEIVTRWFVDAVQETQ